MLGDYWKILIYLKHIKDMDYLTYNTTINTTANSTIISDRRFSLYNLLFVTLMIILNSLGLLINLSVMLMIIKTRFLKTAIHYLMGNLILSDILSSISWLIAIINIVRTKFLNVSTEFINTNCTLVFFFWFTCYTASVITLTELSIERYRTIMYPTKPRRTARIVRFLILITL